MFLLTLCVFWCSPPSMCFVETEYYPHWQNSVCTTHPGSLREVSFSWLKRVVHVMPSLDIWNCQLRSADLQTEKNSLDPNRDMGVVRNEPKLFMIYAKCKNSIKLFRFIDIKTGFTQPFPIALNGKPPVSCTKIPPHPPNHYQQLLEFREP